MAFKREISSPAVNSDPDFSTPQKKVKAENGKSSLKNAPSRRKSATWSDEQIRLLFTLRDEGVSFEEIATYFPGRTRKAVELQYWMRKKEMKEVFTPEKEEELKKKIISYNKDKWANIGAAIGMSARGCQKKAAELGL